MKFFRPCLYSAITTYILISSSVQAAAPSFNVQIGITSEDFEGEKDSYTQLTGTFRYSQGLSRHSVININADLFTRSFDDTDSQDRTGLLGEVIYSYIPTGGYSKPVYSFALRQEFETFELSSQDLNKTSIIAADTIRLDDRLTFTAGLEFLIKSSDLEDITANSIFINTDLQLNSALIMYLNLKFQSEKVETHTEDMAGNSELALRSDFSTHHTPGETGQPTPSLPDTSTGSDFDSDNTIIRIGSNYFFNSNQSIDISFEYSQYAISDNTDIDGKIISLDYFYKF